MSNESQIIQKGFKQRSEWYRAYFRLKLRKASSNLIFVHGLSVQKPECTLTRAASIKQPKPRHVCDERLGHTVLMRRGAWAGTAIKLITDTIPAA